MKKDILKSTLLGSAALIGLVFVSIVFDGDFRREFAKDGFFQIIYALLLIVPFLGLLFVIIAVLVHLFRMLNFNIPVIFIPFLLVITGLFIGSINESYFFELRTVAYIFIAGVIIALCSLPILKGSKRK